MAASSTPGPCLNPGRLAHQKDGDGPGEVEADPGGEQPAEDGQEREEQQGGV